MTDQPTFQSPDRDPSKSEAEYALEKEARLPLTGWQQEVDRGLEFGLEAAESIRDRTIPTFSRGELPHYAGITTFMKAPYLEDVRKRGQLRCGHHGRSSRLRNYLPSGYALWSARYSANFGAVYAL